MNAVAETGRKQRNPRVIIRFSLREKTEKADRDGTAEPVSRDQILRRERRQGNIYFPCSADHEQDWKPLPVDPYLAESEALTPYMGIVL